MNLVTSGVDCSLQILFRERHYNYSKYFPRGLETKANHSCDCNEEYRFVSCAETICNHHNNMKIILRVLSANIKITHLVMND